MASSLAWLDFSEEEQRKAREIVQLFSQQESRDELGIGTVRDALSEAMFPGTSVVQTRARYFLFIPWLFLEGERRGRTGGPLVAWVAGYERRLIEALRAGGEGGVGDGLIGRVAGTKLKILPSAIYWNGLQRFRILRHPGSVEQVAGLAGKSTKADELAMTELVDRLDLLWDPGIPAAPDGFFQTEDANFKLARAEADWLAERIEATCSGTLLAWLVTNGGSASDESVAPWHEPAVALATDSIQRTVNHAELFSTVMHGASLIYNILLAARCAEFGLDELAKRQDSLRETYVTWSKEINDLTPRLTAWSLEDFWALVYGINPRVPARTRAFVEQWISMVRGDAFPDPDNASARTLIRIREQTQKRGQSRLVNDRLLRQWGGEAGLGRLSYRWGTVRRILADIEEGRSRHAGA